MHLFYNSVSRFSSILLRSHPSSRTPVSQEVLVIVKLVYCWKDESALPSRRTNTSFLLLLLLLPPPSGTVVLFLMMGGGGSSSSSNHEELERREGWLAALRVVYCNTRDLIAKQMNIIEELNRCRIQSIV